MSGGSRGYHEWAPIINFIHSSRYEITPAEAWVKLQKVTGVNKNIKNRNPARNNLALLLKKYSKTCHPSHS